ncbi:small GTP-binding isoform A [Micractinium conductrix]|uniref:Small GTP-binding isoform A n=1 Tax=Micractinium conductrix TaxID=554055 RepID=A0A2P6V507_9CHLO|nr:small GTP-binding isoform A [Micractinium conductrix]|eukprot:PSC69165.1 small GTP-binding isoform A [Micractinium conductrix]
MKNAIEGLLGLPDTVLTSIALMLPQRDRLDFAYSCTLLHACSREWFPELTVHLPSKDAKRLAGWLAKSQAKAHVTMNSYLQISDVQAGLAALRRGGACVVSLGPSRFRGPQGFPLAALEGLTALTRLDLRQAGRKQGRWEDLARAPALAELFVESAEETAGSMAVLARLQHLTLLHLGYFATDWDGPQLLSHDFLPPVLTAMTALTALELKGAGPDEEAFGWDMLAALPALRRITYSNNEYFERLPAVVSRLTELQYVDLSFNNLRTASRLRPLRHLLDLDLCKNEMTEVPALTSAALTRLILGGNSVKRGFGRLAALLQLQELQVGHGGKASSGWEVLGALRRLRHLGALADSLTELPRGLSQLTALTSLVVKLNWESRRGVRKHSVMSGWECLWPLSRLQTLELYCMVSRQPPPALPQQLERMQRAGLAVTVTTNPWPTWY